MADRVIQRNDTAARWQSINPILATGEIGIEIDGAKGYKIGDGKTRWNDLPYPANPTNVVQELGNNENAVPSQKLVTEKLSELGSEVNNISGGKINADLFIVGSVTPNNDAIILTNVKNRIVSNKDIVFDRDVTLSANDGWGFYLYFKTDGGWSYKQYRKSYNIPKKQVIRLCVRRENEIPDEIADIEQFASNISYTTLIEELSSAIERTSNELKTYGKSVFFSGDYAVNVDIDTVNGVFNIPNGTLYANNKIINISAQSVNLRNESSTSAWKLVVNVQIGEFKSLPYSTSLGDYETIIGCYTLGNNNQYVSGEYKDGFFCFNYTINGDSNGEVSVKSSFFKGYYSSDANIDTLNGIISFPNGTAFLGNEYIEISAQTVNLRNGSSTSLWKLVLNYKTGVINAASYSTELTKDESVLGCYTMPNRNEYQSGDFLGGYFFFNYTVDGKGNRKSILDFNDFGGKFPIASRGYLNSKPLVIAQFTDLHGDKENLSRYISFVNYYKKYIDVCVNTGDIALDTFENSWDWYGSVADTENILNVIGNHDIAKRNGTSYDWIYYAGEEAYNRYIEPNVSNWNVVQPNDAKQKGLCYYYKDFTEKRIRMICLDMMVFDDAQYQWLVDVLASARSANLTIIIASHFVGEIYDGIDSNFTTLNTPKSTGVAYYNPSTDMTKASKAVDEFMNEGGAFACWVVGHEHKDIFGKVISYPNQLVISSSTSQSGEGSSLVDAAHPVGTNIQDDFNIISIDATAKTVRVFKVGCNMDIYGRTKNYICLSYDKMKVIGQS